MKRRSLWLGLLALLWLVIVVAIYFVAHKPFTPASAARIALAAGQLAVAAGIISLAGGLGTRLMPDFKTSPLAVFALRGALGAGLLSTAVLLIGGLFGTNSILGWVGLLLPLLLLRRSIFRWWGGLLEMKVIWFASSRFGKSVAGLLILIFAATLLVALAPPLKFDALVYHLALPREYLSSGSIAYLPGNIFWGMPQLGEMLYLWAMALAGEQAAACLGWGIGVLAVLGLLGYARSQIGTAAAWVAAASLLAGYTTVSELAWAYVDWFTILYGLAFMVCLHSWVSTGRCDQLILAGLFGGFAFASKYSAGALLAAGAIIISYFNLRWSTPRTTLASLGIFALAAGVAITPWLVKNALATGNPVYPFIFPGGAMDAFRQELYQGFPVWGGLREVLLLPWQATMTGHEGAPGYSASIGPLILGLVPVCVVGWLLKNDPKQKKLRLAAALTVIGLVIWAVGSRLSGYLIQTRLYLAFFPALGLLAGGGYRVLARIEVPGVRLGRITGSLVLLVLGLNVFQVCLDVLSKGAVKTVAGVTSSQEYLDANLGWYAPAMRAIQELPQKARVLMLWEPRSLYCLPRCQPDEVLDRWRRELNTWGDPQRVLAEWRQAGYSHLLIHTAGAEFTRLDDRRYSRAEWQALDQFLASLEPEQEFGEAYALYRLNP